MNILHIIAGDLTGGAARGAYWLHLGLLNCKINSKILTNSKILNDDDTIISINKSKKDRIMNILRAKFDSFPALLYKKRKKIIFSTGLTGTNFKKTKSFKEADIIHLHWICGGFVNIKHLKNINKPIIWTLRDMWPMTGGCHVAMNCNYYETGCGKCRQLGSNTYLDLSRWVLYRKNKYLPRNIHVVGISNWISDVARTSKLFKDSNICTIFNNINTDEFFPIRKTVARVIIDIKTEKKIVLLGAIDINDFYKGFNKYLEALSIIDSDKYFLLFFGNFDANIIKKFKFEYRNFGYIYDAISLRLIYNCADVLVAPSLIEPFGKTIAESMACGTPVVCFDATGPKDIISHKIDGYKAEAFNSEDLAKGIEWIVNYSNYDVLCKNAREKIVENFDKNAIAEKYIELYKKILV
ncbi:glycosyl transferase [Spirochaetia bacterium]|nr:glycosyl transferase [Spirochaetia bacterium]